MARRFGLWGVGTILTKRFLGTDKAIEWVRARAASEALKRIGYLYASLAAPYGDAATRDALLKKDVDRIEAEAADLLAKQAPGQRGNLPGGAIDIAAYIEKRVKQLKLVASEPAGRKAPPVTLKEAQREMSAARKEYEKAIELFHKRSFDDAGRRFEDFIEKHPDEKEFLDRARMYLAACRNGKKNRAALPSEPDELYHAAYGQEGATELAILKNRTGPTTYIDLYYYKKWLRF